MLSDPKYDQEPDDEELSEMLDFDPPARHVQSENEKLTSRRLNNVRPRRRYIKYTCEMVERVKAFDPWSWDPSRPSFSVSQDILTYICPRQKALFAKKLREGGPTVRLLNFSKFSVRASLQLDTLGGNIFVCEDSILYQVFRDGRRGWKCTAIHLPFIVSKVVESDGGAGYLFVNVGDGFAQLLF